MFKGTWCCKKFSIMFFFGITKTNDECIGNNDIPQQSFLDIGNVLLKNGGIDLLEPKENIIVERVDIPEQSFLDLGKTLFENANCQLEEHY
jgi:hypothetical protein